MAVSYKIALPSLKKFEGGLVYIASEGQWTNRGIQYTTYISLGQKLGLVTPLTLDRFKAMTVADFEKFVKYFWDLATFKNAIKDGDAAVMMFQALWGSGNTGIIKAQQGLNNAYNLNLDKDGIVGVQTVNAINSHSNAANVIWVALFNYYMALVELNPAKYGAFKQGWANRLNWMKPKPKGSDIAIIGLIIGAIGLALIVNNQ